MKGEKDENEDVQNRMPVKAQGPVGFFVFCEKKVTGEDFNAEKNDQGHTADTVKKPDEHTPPCMVSNNDCTSYPQCACTSQNGPLSNKELSLCQEKILFTIRLHTDYFFDFKKKKHLLK